MIRRTAVLGRECDGKEEMESLICWLGVINNTINQSLACYFGKLIRQSSPIDTILINITYGEEFYIPGVYAQVIPVQ